MYLLLLPHHRVVVVVYVAAPSHPAYGISHDTTRELCWSGVGIAYLHTWGIKYTTKAGNNIQMDFNGDSFANDDASRRLKHGRCT